MSEPPKLIRVRMIRSTLDQIPQFPLPSGFTIRDYRPGDIDHWIRILTQAEQFREVTPALFQQQFQLGEQSLRERQLFLCEATGHPIGTATAWLDPVYQGHNYGRVHWVAVTPDFQGQGLSKPLMTAVCNRLIELKHTRAYLCTETIRRPAISLYLTFGFLPEIENDQDRAIWRELQQQGLSIPLNLDHG